MDGHNEWHKVLSNTESHSSRVINAISRLDHSVVDSRNLEDSQAIDAIIASHSTQAMFGFMQHAYDTLAIERAALERRLVISLERVRDIRESYQLAVERFALGFDGPVQKSLLIIAVLKHLRTDIPGVYISEIASDAIQELKACMEGCGESIVALEAIMDESSA